LTEFKSHNKHYKYKIPVIGDPAVGKTSLIQKYTKGSFQNDYLPTIGAQFSKYDEDIEGDRVSLLIWDIAGQDTYHFLRPAFYEGSKGAIVVYSLEDSEQGKLSYDHIDEWHDEIKEYCSTIPVILIGNKVDLVDEQELNEKKIQKLVKKRGFIGHYRTSAKNGTGVLSAFQTLVNELINKYQI